MSEKHPCSVKPENAKSLINMNDMLFSIKSLSLYDGEDSGNP